MDRRITDRIMNSENIQKTIIDENTKIKGNFTSDDDVTMRGNFDGTMKLNSLLLVGRSGKTKGKINAENMIVEGEVEGEVIVQNTIEVRNGGRFKGNVICKQIAIEEGAFFQGDVNMDNGRKITPTYFKEKRKDLKKK
ncbi:MAG: polymer-forming cytoskeletal protein [Candidatus Aminicenantes bacterium]|nr:polymer-forming cytoskeletal protein [Candidatus Aminicenantes bacterium]